MVRTSGKNSDGWVKKSKQLMVEGKLGRGTSRKTGLSVKDMKELKPRADDAMDR